MRVWVKLYISYDFFTQLQLGSCSNLRQAMETLEFIIYPDGRVEEVVSGIAGNSCVQITASIEARLGIVASQQLTSDYFAQRQAQYCAAVQSHQEF